MSKLFLFRELVVGAGLSAILVACSEPVPGKGADTPATGTAASTGASGAAPARTYTTAAVSSLGGGVPLQGQVSNLTGEISGFTTRQTATGTVVELATDVLFAFDSAELAAEASDALKRTAELVAASGGRGPVLVVGHTDSSGKDDYNLALSQRRARAVAQWLSAQGGVSQDRLRAEGRGESEPVVANTRPDGSDSPEGRQKNRRVEVVIPKT